jgi:hypothetical protein
MLCLSIINWTEKLMQSTKECICNSGKTNFDAIEFNTNSSRIEVVCGKCHGVVCWWPISTDQTVSKTAHETQKSSAIPTRIK